MMRCVTVDIGNGISSGVVNFEDATTVQIGVWTLGECLEMHHFIESIVGNVPSSESTGSKSQTGMVEPK